MPVPNLHMRLDTVDSTVQHVNVSQPPHWLAKMLTVLLCLCLSCTHTLRRTRQREQNL